MKGKEKGGGKKKRKQEEVQSSGETKGSNVKLPKNLTPAQRCKCMTSELTSEPSLKDPQLVHRISFPINLWRPAGGGGLCVSFLVGLAAECFLWVQYRLTKEQAVTGMPLLLNLGFVLFCLSCFQLPLQLYLSQKSS